jgi:hypothetical protein
LFRSTLRLCLLIGGTVASVVAIIVWAITESSRYAPWVVSLGLVVVMIAVTLGAREQDVRHGKDLSELRGRISELTTELTEAKQEANHQKRENETLRTDAIIHLAKLAPRTEVTTSSPHSISILEPSQFVISGSTGPQGPQSPASVDRRRALRQQLLHMKARGEALLRIPDIWRRVREAPAWQDETYDLLDAALVNVMEAQFFAQPGIAPPDQPPNVGLDQRIGLQLNALDNLIGRLDAQQIKDSWNA